MITQEVHPIQTVNADLNSEYLEIRKNLSLFKRRVQISSQQSDFDIKGQKMSKLLPFSLFPLLIGAQEVFKNSS